MERNITEKEKEQILNLGAFNYDAIRCSAVLGWDIQEVIELFSNQESEFYKIYNTGLIRSDYVIDLKLFEQAQSGDIKSLDKLEFRKKTRERNKK